MKRSPWSTDINDEKWWDVFKNPVGFVIVSAVILTIIVIVWHFFKPYPKNEGGVPIVEASKEPIKIVNDNSNLTIPHQDKTVYKKLMRKGEKDSSQDTKVEHVIAPPSAKEVLEPQNTIAAETKGSAETIIPPPPPKPAEKKTEKQKLSPEGISTVRIQIAALPSEELAKKEFERLKKKHRDLLGDKKASYGKINLGEKGTYFRVYVQGFPSKANAQKVCQELKNRNVGCLIAK